MFYLLVIILTSQKTNVLLLSCIVFNSVSSEEWMMKQLYKIINLHVLQ